MNTSITSMLAGEALNIAADQALNWSNNDGGAVRELAHRSSGGLEIRLLWDSEDGSVMLEVWQPQTDERFTFVVAPRDALEAFYHPFAHLPHGDHLLDHDRHHHEHIGTGPALGP
jgi:hypothetical protein